MEIIVDNLSYKYSEKTVNEIEAISGISLRINSGEFVAIIGHTGSGKSTFIQHLNGLIKAQSGSIYYNKEDISQKGYNLSKLRQELGMVFQYPEYQLFESTVLEDVKFGPKNQGLDDKNASIRAYEALEMLNFPRDLVSQSPLDLSGGQKRLVAIAGVLAMKPKVLILDEPTAGLDPKTKKDILDNLKKLHETTKTTIILVTHCMEDAAEYANRVLVINEGKLLLDGSPRDVFYHTDELESIGLRSPQTVYLSRKLKSLGIKLREGLLTKDEIIDELKRVLRSKNA